MRVCPKPVLAMQDQYEVVDRSGFRYQVTKVGAMAFAQEIAAAVKPSNWVRAVGIQRATCIMCAMAGRVAIACGLSTGWIR